MKRTLAYSQRLRLGPRYALINLVRSPIALVAISLSVAAGVALAKDCGRLPTGKNPSPEEIGKTMEVLSAKHSVPTEVLKGIAYQESGVQQWRPDGSFVHNVTDCGMGMMQLTGSTAAQFDVDKLKDDWKYNLECGVKVLCQKWDRAQREGKVGADPSDRRVLENWYYAVAYYYGKPTDSYVAKIFGHVGKRPGVLQQLLKRSVEITLPTAAIKGFTHGKKFRALEGDKFVDEEGKTVKAPTHVGTIGDDETLAKLEVALAKAKKALEGQKIGEAVKLLAQACAVELELEARAKARKLLDELEEQGNARLAEADEKLAAGDKDGALKIAKKVAQDFAPTPLGKKAKDRAAEIAKGPAGAAPAGSSGGPPQAAPAPAKKPAAAEEPRVSPTPPPSAPEADPER
jgi:hypothetical protein